jgi:hypothetical protein
MPENPSATAFGAEVAWTAGVIIGATIVIVATKKVARKVIALKNRNK